MAERIILLASGTDYESAVGTAMAELTRYIGRSDAKVYRVLPAPEATEYYDWAVEDVEAELSPGKNSVNITATFVLVGSEDIV